MHGNCLAHPLALGQHSIPTIIAETKSCRCPGQKWEEAWAGSSRSADTRSELHHPTAFVLAKPHSKWIIVHWQLVPSLVMNYLPDNDFIIVNDRCPKDMLTNFLKPQD